MVLVVSVVSLLSAATYASRSALLELARAHRVKVTSRELTRISEAAHVDVDAAAQSLAIALGGLPARPDESSSTPPLRRLPRSADPAE